MINEIINTCYIAAQESPSVRVLASYSHMVPVFFTLAMAILVYLKAKHSPLSRVFLMFSTAFSVWLLGDLLAWTSNNYNLVYTSWSLLVYIEVVFFILGLSFAAIFAYKKDLPIWAKSVLFSTTLIPLGITITQNSVVGFYHPICEAFNNNFLDTYKLYLEGIILAILFVFMLVPFFRKSSPKEKKSSFIVLGSMFLFLSVFAITEHLSAITGVYEINLYALFIIPVFLIAIIYSIFALDIFNIRVVSTYFLVFGFLILTASQLFFVQSGTETFLTTLTVALSVALSVLLFRNLRKESEQRIYIEKLNTNLRDLIKQRESLVHLVTHKVKGSFTRSKYIFAEMLDGTFGEISPDIRKYASQGLESNNMGIQTVDLVLNADNLQKGVVKYDMKPFDFKEMALKVVQEKEASVQAKGLEIEKNIGEGNFKILGDAFWIKEVVNNLLENSIKYTPSGKITIGLENSGGKVKLSIKDTGVGINDEDKKLLFTEGGRGKDSVKINVDSTGYGLYSVKLILDAHKARVWGESEGSGKGSQFYVEFDESK